MTIIGITNQERNLLVALLDGVIAKAELDAFYAAYTTALPGAGSLRTLAEGVKTKVQAATP